MDLKRVCVFCGSSRGSSSKFAALANDLGQHLAVNNITLVYGGGKVGLMGILADATLHHGGVVIGVIPESLRRSEVGHDDLTELHVVPDMHTRKALMADLADGFIALPGGLGTFEELFEQLTWAQLGFHRKPCVVLDADGFYDPLFALLATSIEQGFMRADTSGLLGRVRTPVDAIAFITAERALVAPKWIA